MFIWWAGGFEESKFFIAGVLNSEVDGLQITKESKTRVLLLNPPGERLYVRDYYCSKISKADYLYHPTDLLIASGWLEPYFELLVLDCIVDGITKNEALVKIKAYKPDAIFFLTGSVSRDEDFAFLKKVKNNCGSLMVGSGDCLLDEFDEIRNKAPWIDAVVTDFTSDGLRNFLRNELTDHNVGYTDIVDLREKESGQECVGKRSKGMEIEVPTPRYELFPNKKYRYPFVRSRPFASILTDYGCPFRCKFCVMAELGFKRRSTANVIEELDHVNKMGFRDIYFVDQTFGCNRTRLKELCTQMISRNYKFRWVAFTRADVMDRETLELMHAAGCHMLMFGIESPIQRVLDEIKKDISLDKIETCFRLCKEIGISTLATFIVGLPGTTYEENEQIAEYAIAIDADYASFNVLVPRVNTVIRQEAKEHGWLNSESDQLDQSGSYGALETGSLSEIQIRRLHRKITRRFYFRPGYIVKRILALETPYDFYSAIRNSAGIVQNLLQGWIATFRSYHAGR